MHQTFTDVKIQKYELSRLHGYMINTI